MLKKRIQLIYFITFILAFCSIVYELLLAQSLSAFLENTILRYSVTIGLYMFSMGMGALMAQGRFTRHPVMTLLGVELLLTVIGGFAVVSLHMVDMLGVSRFIFSGFAHTLIILIGILTGFEIPLLIEIGGKKQDHRENIVLAVDYLGAFAGTVAFAFIFYSKLGLMLTAFLMGFLNAAAGVLLFTQLHLIQQSNLKMFYSLLYVQAFFLTIMGICIIFSSDINTFFMEQYLK